MPLDNLSPLRRRWIILGIVFAALALNYFDRQIVAVLKVTLKDEFAIDDYGYAIILNVFMVCYAISYPIVGWLVDRFGPRIMMLAAVVAWSAACIGAGLSRALAPFLFFRAMLGVAEPTAYPAQLRVVATWFPGTLRATANSICQAGSSVGSIVAPALVAWLTLNFNWHVSFLVPGMVGFGLAACWWLVYRDPPEIPAVAASASSWSTPAVAQATAFSWPGLWRTRTLWGILLCRFLSDPVWYFCLFWLFGYLQENSGQSLEEVGMMGWVPFLVGNAGAVGASALSDTVVRFGITPLRARKLLLAAAACFAPICILTPSVAHSPVGVLVVFSIVAIVCLTWLFTTCVIVAEAFPPANVGGVLGIAAGFGAAGGMLFNFFVGEAARSFGMGRMFAVMAFLHPLATIVVWATVRPEEPPQITASTSHI